MVQGRQAKMATAIRIASRSRARRRPFGIARAAALAVAVVAFLSWTLPAGAFEFVVTSPVDAVDDNVGDGVCATSAGDCTLRAAIQEANAQEGHDSIVVPPG